MKIELNVGHNTWMFRTMDRIYWKILNVRSSFIGESSRKWYHPFSVTMGFQKKNDSKHAVYNDRCLYVDVMWFFNHAANAIGTNYVNELNIYAIKKILTRFQFQQQVSGYLKFEQRVFRKFMETRWVTAQLKLH